MILIDTSAWIEFLRDTGSPICQRVDDLLAAEIATCDAVRMEVLAPACIGVFVKHWGIRFIGHWQ